MFFSGRSEYFKALLHFQDILRPDAHYEKVEEDGEDDSKQIIELKDIRPNIFTIVYTFIYTESAVVRILHTCSESMKQLFVVCLKIMFACKSIECLYLLKSRHMIVHSISLNPYYGISQTWKSGIMKRKEIRKAIPLF